MSTTRPPGTEPETDAAEALDPRQARAGRHLHRLDRLQLVLGPVVVAFFLVLGVYALTSGPSPFFALLCAVMAISATVNTVAAVRRLRRGRR